MTREEILTEVEQEFGSVPGWIGGMPEAMLENFWNLMSWLYSDSLLSARDKNLVGFGASAALHCEYGIPNHVAEFPLYDMGDEHVKEASLVVHFITGISNYLYATNYSKETFLQESEAAVEHIQKSSQT